MGAVGDDIEAELHAARQLIVHCVAHVAVVTWITPQAAACVEMPNGLAVHASMLAIAASRFAGRPSNVPAYHVALARHCEMGSGRPGYRP